MILWSRFWTRYGPFVIASALLLLGYRQYAPGAAYSFSAEHYRAWSFPAFRYSDLIWLYLRDGLDSRGIPYIDFPLEYPPLTGLLTWIFSWAPDLPTYFTLTYTTLAAAALLTIWALQRISGANAWLFAAAPALFLYTGHQWDMAAIAMAAVGLIAFQRGRDGWGVLALIIGTSLKLFPVVFVAAAVVERVRDRRYRSAAAISLGFVAGTLLINVPVAYANFDGWSFFYRWNRDRLADSGIWVLWRSAPTDDLTRWSLVAALTGGIALTLVAWRSRGPLIIPLGATYLLWWLLVNKTFTTHLMLWAFLGLALLGAPLWLWGLTVTADLVGFQLGNYLNLYNIAEYRHAPLIRKAVENIYDPVQLARSAVLLAGAIWGIHLLKSPRSHMSYARRAPTVSPASEPKEPATPALPLGASIAPPATSLRVAAYLFGPMFAFTIATIVMTWPYALHLRDATVVGFDPLLQIWISEWIQHVLVSDPIRLYDANIFYPFAQTLAYTDANVPGALIAAPLRLITGDPILTNSMLILATFVLAAAGVYALVLMLTRNRGAALIAGLAYAFLPYRMVHLWHLNWLEGALLPWVILAMLRVIERPTVTRGAILGVLAGILVLISFYFSVQVVLVVGVIGTVYGIARRRFPPRSFWLALGIATAIAALITVPFYLPYLQVREEQRLERSVVDTEQYKALPESYLQLAPWDLPNRFQQLVGVRAGPNESLTEVGQAPHADGHQHAEIVIEDALYPGSVAVMFALIGVVAWPHKRWLTVALLLIGAIAVVLSLGPTWGLRHGAGIPLPYGWLFDHAPFFRSMRVPARLGGLAGLVVVLLAGLGLAAVWNALGKQTATRPFLKRPATGPLLTMLVAALVLADLWTGSVPLAPIDRSTSAMATAEWLATQPPGPVMEFPAESVFADAAAASVRWHYGETLFRSTLHWKPMVNGNSGFIPRAYSDFIERFVGELPRPDGTTTPRISHLNSETVRLLSQIGVRYVVFFPSQYRDEDWPAVRSGLVSLEEAGLISSGGQHGDGLVYLINPSVPAIASPTIRLFAPTLLTKDSGWAPWIGIESPGGIPAALALTRPSGLETTWYDNDGKLLWRGSEGLPLPAVLDDTHLLCGPSICLTARSFDDLTQLPPPDLTGSWSPSTPGHYIVRVQLTGDQPLDCRIDLDLVEDSAEVWQRSRDDTNRWAECVEWSPNPVNNPGAVPFKLSSPSVTLVDNTVAVDISVTPRIDEEVRGWFILAPPGVPDPWNQAVYQSAVQQKLLPAAEQTSFEWSTAIDAEVSPGVYALTVWFHHRGASGWNHAAGGDIDLAPVVVGEEHSLTWAGPIRGRLIYSPSPLVAGSTHEFELAISGESSQLKCAARWRLYSGPELVAEGNADSCDRPRIRLPAEIKSGSYRMHIDLLADREGKLQLSDAVSTGVSVIDRAATNAPT